APWKAATSRRTPGLRRSRLRYSSAQALIDGAPIDIRQKRLDVFRSISRLVIENERVFPNVHHQSRIEARHVARLVQRDPMVRQLTVGRIFVADGPADAAHFADADKLCLPDFVTAEALLGSFAKRRV